MKALCERHLLDADLRKVPAVSCDVLVVGAGVAGLTAALHASGEGAAVVVLAKAGPMDSNTANAQGGIAAALGGDDSPELHLKDTLLAGAGLSDEAAARKVVTEGPALVRELARAGAEFDLAADGASFALTLEAAHSRSRVAHARGDATGREVARSLVARAEADPNVTMLTRHFVADLLHHEGRVFGALALDLGRGGALVRVDARATVLATGGAGRIYRETTNPEVATGDGVALAFRAGAGVADLEFVQFHPTTLYLAGAPRLLVSEAVRGEGAYLLNTRRERFMPARHPDAELAPRDVVSAGIVEEMAATRSPHVYLDLRRIPAGRIVERFPMIADVCAMYGLDITKSLVPVRPAAHYMMGGVVTGLDARTSVEGLYAAGEVACTGLHGANRLASNSLLEGLVFGREAGVNAAAAARPGGFPLRKLARVTPSRDVELDAADVRQSLASLMDRAAGVFRERAELEPAMNALRHWGEYVYPVRFREPSGLELQNMLAVAALVVTGALERTESRGAHRRLDFPSRDDAKWLRRITRSVASE